MPRGGARNRSGPAPDPASGRSEARGYSLTALPAEGYRGRAPRFPLPTRTVYYVVDGVRCVDDAATDAVAARELELWKWAWRTPQAAAWSLPAEQWRWHTVAMWVRTAVICEGSEATAADKGSLHRFADQIGLTTAGLAQMGWKVAVDELGERAAGRTSSRTSSARSTAEEVEQPQPRRGRRLRSVGDQ